MANAMAAAEAIQAEPAFGPFMAMIDGETVSMRHETIALAMD